MRSIFYLKNKNGLLKTVEDNLFPCFRDDQNHFHGQLWFLMLLSKISLLMNASQWGIRKCTTTPLCLLVIRTDYMMALCGVLGEFIFASIDSNTHRIYIFAKKPRANENNVPLHLILIFSSVHFYSAHNIRRSFNYITNIMFTVRANYLSHPHL